MSQSKACARVALVALLAAPSAAQEVGVIEHELDNGLTLLLVPRSGDPNISARVGGQGGLGLRAAGHHRRGTSLRAHDVQGDRDASAPRTSKRTCRGHCQVEAASGRVRR